MSELTDAAKRELDRLERQLEIELAANPTYQRIKKVKTFLAEYPDDSVNALGVPRDAVIRAAPNAHTGAGAPAPNALFPPGTGRALSRKARLLALVGELIDRAGGTVTRQTIISEAINQRIVPQETATVIIAPLLSETKDYKSDGKGNWTRAGSKGSSQGETGAVAAPASH